MRRSVALERQSNTALHARTF